jgi:hypothetical protein
MLEDNAGKYVQLGAVIADMRIHYAVVEDKEDAENGKTSWIRPTPKLLT